MLSVTDSPDQESPWGQVKMEIGQEQPGGTRAGWLAGRERRISGSFTPSAASLYLLPQLYYVVHGTAEWHLGRGPNRSRCPAQRVLGVLPSQL